PGRDHQHLHGHQRRRLLPGEVADQLQRHAAVFAGVDDYTRRGDFQLNANGNLVNGAGYYLEGIPIDPTTGNPVGNVAAPLQFANNFLPASATSTISYGLNLPTVPATTAYSASIPNSELLKVSDFSAGHDPTIAGTGQVIGSDVSTFVKESVDGGAVTIYDATGTPSNMQLRWAKTDSVANGGTDTWQLFYQVDSNAAGTTVAWQNVGTAFKFDTTGQLNPPVTSLALTGVTINGLSLGNINVNMPSGSVTQFANASGA